MSKASQFFGGGKPPLGSLVDFPSTTPSLITTDNMTFLRSGTTVNSDPYVDLPSAFKGKIPHYISANALTYSIWPSFSTLGFIASDGGTNMVAHPGVASGTFMFSNDSGTTWWSCNYVYGVQVVSVLFFNGKFVFVHIDGSVFHTPPTFSNSSQPVWSSISRALTNYSGYVNRARVANDKLYFLPASYSNTSTNQSSSSLYYTTDLVNIQSTTVLGTALWNDIAYVGTRYVACYNNADITSGKLWWSANGIDGWTTSTTSINTATIESGGFGRIGQMYVAGSTLYVIGQASLTSSANVWYGWRYATTTDGNTISLSATLNNASMSSADLPSASYLNGRHHIGWSNTGLVMTSTNGSTWTTTPNPAASITQSSIKPGQFGQSIAYVGGTYHYMYSGTVNSQTTIFASSSTDMLTNQAVKEWWGTILYNIRACVGENGKIIATQTGYGERANAIVYGQSFSTSQFGWATNHPASMLTREYLESSDYGATWTKRKFPNTGWYSTMCWTGTNFIAIRERRPNTELLPGATYTTMSNDIIRSSNGIDWTIVDAPTISSSTYKWQYLLTDPTNAPGRIIAIGRQWGSNTVVWMTSTDEGSTWSTPTNIASLTLKHAMVANNTTILLGINSGSTNIIYCLDNKNPNAWWNITVSSNLGFSVVSQGREFLIFGRANEPIIVDYGNLRSASWQYTISAIDPSNSSMVYAESDPSNSNIIHAWAGQNYYRSTNAGATWTKYTSGLNFGDRGIHQMLALQNGGLYISDSSYIRSSGANPNYVLNERELSPSDGVIKYMRII